ncbi:MAG: cupin domain-containing protein, partial [Hyphomicrobiales bacterium]|nr:cupin domain-containing protein [Hyphomicrobiales bacterium]
AGARSSFNHWHESEDEFVFVVSGDVVLIEGDTETPLKTGDAAGFKAGEPVGHNIENRSDKPAILLEIGTRAIGERCHYPGRDLIVETINSKDRVMTREGIPYPGTASPDTE